MRELIPEDFKTIQAWKPKLLKERMSAYGLICDHGSVFFYPSCGELMFVDAFVSNPASSRKDVVKSMVEAIPMILEFAKRHGLKVVVIPAASKSMLRILARGGMRGEFHTVDLCYLSWEI